VDSYLLDNLLGAAMAIEKASVRSYASGVGFSWFTVWGVIGGPLAWAIDQGSSYALVQSACSGMAWPLHLSTAVAILLDASALIAAWRLYKIQTSEGVHDRAHHDPSRWTGTLGVASSLSFLIVIIAVAMPKWMMSACDR
jgi:hypothetical protein